MTKDLIKWNDFDVLDHATSSQPTLTVNVSPTAETDIYTVSLRPRYDDAKDKVDNLGLSIRQETASSKWDAQSIQESYTRLAKTYWDDHSWLSIVHQSLVALNGFYLNSKQEAIEKLALIDNLNTKFAEEHQDNWNSLDQQKEEEE